MRYLLPASLALNAILLLSYVPMEPGAGPFTTPETFKAKAEAPRTLEGVVAEYRATGKMNLGTPTPQQRRRLEEILLEADLNACETEKAELTSQLSILQARQAAFEKTLADASAGSGSTYTFVQDGLIRMELLEYLENLNELYSRY